MNKKRQLTSFGQIVKVKLIEKQMKQGELAEKIGADITYLSRILYGERKGNKYKAKIVTILDIKDIA